MLTTYEILRRLRNIPDSMVKEGTQLFMMFGHLLVVDNEEAEEVAMMEGAIPIRIVFETESGNIFDLEGGYEGQFTMNSKETQELKRKELK